MQLKILVLAGDGVGAEVTCAAVQVLQAVAGRFGHTLELSEGLIGGIASGVVLFIFLVPMTFQTSAWYAGGGFAALFLVTALSLYAFRTSLGDRRPPL